MKIRFLATEQGARYQFSGETITIDGESLDLSGFPEGGKFEGVEGDERHVVRDIKRQDGGLRVTLCQAPPVTKITYFKDGKMKTLAVNQPVPEHDRKIEHRGGHWRESEWINAEDYDPETLYIQQL